MKTETVTTTTTKFNLDENLEVTFTDEVKNGTRQKRVTLAQYERMGGFVYLTEEQLPKLITALRQFAGLA